MRATRGIRPRCAVLREQVDARRVEGDRHLAARAVVVDLLDEQVQHASALLGHQRIPHRVEERHRRVDVLGLDGRPLDVHDLLGDVGDAPLEVGGARVQLGEALGHESPVAALLVRQRGEDALGLLAAPLELVDEVRLLLVERGDGRLAVLLHALRRRAQELRVARHLADAVDDVALELVGRQRLQLARLGAAPVRRGALVVAVRVVPFFVTRDFIPVPRPLRMSMTWRSDRSCRYRSKASRTVAASRSLTTRRPPFESTS
jgi:hypothetical protein